MGIVNYINSIISEAWNKLEEEDKVVAQPVEKIVQSSKKFIYKPKDLQEFIGQEKAKETVEINIKKILTLRPVHFIFSAPPGHGKTTLGYIVSKAINARVYYTIGGTVTLDTLCDFFRFNEQQKDLVVLFIDEVHSLDKACAEVLYPAIEDFSYSGIDIKPFIFMGATTEKYTLIKKFQPLVDRCGCDCELEFYTVKNMVEILTQYKNQLYATSKISPEEIEVISKNCRYTPRIGLAMIDDLVVCGSVDRVLSSHRILCNGLKDIDIKILTCLHNMKVPVGEQALSLFSGINLMDYRHSYEPFLIREGYISRTARGRIITEYGIKTLEGIANE